MTRGPRTRMMGPLNSAMTTRSQMMPRASVEAEAANVTHGEEVEDECRDEGYHVGIKRGEDAFLDARGCRCLDRFALAYLLVETLHDKNRGVGGHAYVDDDARNARQGKREPSHLGEQGKQAEIHDGHEKYGSCGQKAKPLVEDEKPHHDKRDADEGCEYARPQRLLASVGPTVEACSMESETGSEPESMMVLRAFASSTV